MGSGNDDPESGTDDASDDRIRVWLVERTFSDDELNLIILVYATTDGRRYLRKERALPSFSGPGRATYAAVDARPSNLGTVADETTRERYATEAQRMAAAHAPDDTV